jgi:hypothetical protein
MMAQALLFAVPLAALLLLIGVAFDAFDPISKLTARNREATDGEENTQRH